MRAQLAPGVSTFGAGQHQKWGRRFRLPTRAKPEPIGSLRCPSRADRVVLHVTHDSVQLDFIPHTMVERFVLPEGLARSAQDQIGLSCAGALQPPRNHRERGLWQQYNMHMVGHDYPNPFRSRHTTEPQPLYG